ncbi:hypothetical protein Gasu2_18590 [Galdieria sulphuraria]|uniref:Uncharacterized protein n=1 Tax=Galdieria sulphuraria TaxID=130081 RepID=M2VZN0_GALSU|nr:uncharacterized protein Gasu_36940 [Galdieria sulphuraria]EME28801.1 hypothetical protein Gasu_36940 [Galdieria sulphuraria]GJD07500.1 hypothetical protein Gasu2_18590 [Galdieria sulphuraria]|eukprot:XP_005705321.1 hypothetical protein Gasu_36940 [Galdieria sulphuraria]
MELPVIDLSKFLQENLSTCEQDCRTLANVLRQYGAAAIYDPRVKQEDSERFLDMMEKYFEQPTEIKLEDARPQLYYQVGVTPEFTEQPRDNSEYASQLLPEHKPTAFKGKDCKWRFQWRIGERAESSKYPELVAEPVVPRGFPDWPAIMNEWGEKLLCTGFTIAEMLAIGLELPRESFLRLLTKGSHLLAPTGVDVDKYEKGHVVAGFHYDLNFLTLHGKARYPGLFIWTREGIRIPCKVPDGCLLIQVGAQLEYLTAGYLEKGFHEVVITEEVKQKAKERNQKSHWRVSSTLFVHVEADAILEPLGHFHNFVKHYHPKEAGAQVAQELNAIQLAQSI